jgi:RNA polymerase sigma factor (sigma-70 family)
MVRRRVGRRLSLRIDPEDVIQDVYLRAQTEWVLEPPPVDKREAWLFRLVWSRAIDLIRVHLGPRRDINREYPWPADAYGALADHVADTHIGPLTNLIREETREHVRRAVASLKPRDREVVFLRFDQQLKFGEIAEILQIDEDAATKRCARALLRLRDRVKHLLTDPSA